MKISISICPTNMEIGSGGDILDEGKYLAAIRAAVLRQWPQAKITCLQVGYRQGDEWFRMNGRDSDEVAQIVEDIDTSDEDLY